MSICRLFCVFALVAVLPGAAFAENFRPGAAGLYASGQYEAAAEAAAREETAAGDALAARALLAAARFAPKSQRRGLVDRANAIARDAIRRDSSYAEGYLQLAVALGYRGRSLGSYQAHAIGLADDAREAIDAVLALEPDNAWALALSGAWHLEIVAEAGPLLASALYNAERTRGIDDIRTAIANADGNPIILHQCALQLLAHDARAFGPEAERALLAAMRAHGRDAFERHTVRRADRLLRAYRGGNDFMLQHEIERDQVHY